MRVQPAKRVSEYPSQIEPVLSSIVSFNLQITRRKPNKEAQSKYTMHLHSAQQHLIYDTNDSLAEKHDGDSKFSL